MCVSVLSVLCACAMSLTNLKSYLKPARIVRYRLHADGSLLIICQTDKIDKVR